ncbi:DUF5317 domain-containing protein [Vallitalea guaymasensis]|uniref:DUF5317 domain-containing protein n=1 Tax=Vallitalea guaymasensis TaxID=1185412 RepID=A0A8J8MB20_9FIRM|nr:DUF5317 domain-containing protein [Vallitalea guaymasensis]QUH29503.1 DUF5317 domain-containing protein [Vallitalea guaymasensis]
MIIEGIVLSIIVAYIRKGRLINFENIEIKAWYLIIASQLLQIIAIRLGNTININTTAFYIMHISSYIILLIPLVINHRLLSMNLLSIGTILNLIPIALNNGQMPVYLPQGANASFDMGHVLATNTTKAYILSDIIPILKPYPLPKIISIGDIFILIGIFLLIQHAMLKTKTKS